MKLFFRYLKYKKKVFFIFFMFAVIFTAVFFLYRLPIGAVLYPSVLYAAVIAGLLIYDFQKVKKEHLNTKSLVSFTDVKERGLPKSQSLAEEDLGQVISRLCEIQTDFETEIARQNDSVSEYYTLWVHQIKTPISSMRLKLKSEDSAFARSLLSDLSRIEQYVEMVLVFLRLGSKSTDYVIKNIKLDYVVRQAVKKFAGEFILKKLTLKYEPTEMIVLSDEKWLLFVIEQVISNALKYTPSGSVSVYTENNTLCIEDTGIGVASEDIPRIFEKGYTGINGRKDKSASGIGLYLCRMVCERLGHKIYAESEIGIGTKIMIDLSTKSLGAE